MDNQKSTNHGVGAHGRVAHRARTFHFSYIALMASTFEVLADRRRRQILDLLRAAERPVNELVESLALSQPAVSKHLRVLREAGLVEVRQDAQRRWYRLRAEPLTEIDEWLTPYRRFWEDRLDVLERHLDAITEGASRQEGQ